MSPVSRGRGKKNRSSSGPKSKRATVRVSTSPAAPSGPDSGPGPNTPFDRSDRSDRSDQAQLSRPERSTPDSNEAIVRGIPGAAKMMAAAHPWWPGSHAEMLDAASGLLGCPDPTNLEDSVCELLGQHWRKVFDEQSSGFCAQEWLMTLVVTSRGRAEEPAVRRLLYGIGVIAVPGLAELALDLLRETAADGEEPAWLQLPPTVTAAPDLLMLRDAYGLRFGLLAPVTGPGGQTRTYLFDVDLCYGSYQVLTSGYHPDTATAVAAWRDLVGVSAAGCEPGPAPADLLPHVLPAGGLLDAFLGRPLSDNHFAELYRGDRIVFAIADALEEAGLPIRWQTGAGQNADERADALGKQFRTWADAAGVDLPEADLPEADRSDDDRPDDDRSDDDRPGDDVVAWLLQDWVAPDLPDELDVRCSPHRIARFTAYLMNNWHDEHRSRALPLLEPWARFCVERTGLTGPAAEHTLTWARRAALEPAQVGGDLGNHLNRPIDETTVTGPPLPVGSLARIVAAPELIALPQATQRTP